MNRDPKYINGYSDKPHMCYSYLVDKSVGYVLSSKNKLVVGHSETGELGISNESSPVCTKRKREKNVEKGEKQQDTKFEKMFLDGAEKIREGLDNVAGSIDKLAGSMKPNDDKILMDKMAIMINLERRIQNAKEKGLINVANKLEKSLLDRENEIADLA